MAKKQTEALTNKWYQSALLPWSIILIIAALVAGFISGWHSHQGMQQTIDSKARIQTEILVSELKNDEQ